MAPLPWGPTRRLPIACQSTSGGGKYTLSAVATENLGAKATNSVSIVVNSLPSPVCSSSQQRRFLRRASQYHLTATANDTDGSVTKVEFFEGANNWARHHQALTASLETTWRPAPTPDGQATDDRGATATSAAITISVTNSVATSVLLRGPAWSGGDFRFSFSSQAVTARGPINRRVGSSPMATIHYFKWGMVQTLSVTSHEHDLQLRRRMYRVCRPK
jgi:hypothetical protein